MGYFDRVAPMEDNKGIPEAVTVKQRILDYYYDCVKLFKQYKYFTSQITSIPEWDSPTKNQMAAIQTASLGGFKASLEGLYVAVKVYKLDKKEVASFKILEDGMSRDDPPDFKYLVECLDALGDVIKRLGISDFQIKKTPAGKAYLEE